MQTRRPLLRLLYLAEILSCCARLPHICDKFPKGNSLRTEFRSQISNQTPASKLFSHPRHCNIFLAQLPFGGMRAGRIAYRIWICSVANRGYNIERSKVFRISQHDVATVWHGSESKRATTTATATAAAEFYDDIYMSAIFYRALNARSRSVSHWRGGLLWIKVRFKDFFLIPRRDG